MARALAVHARYSERLSRVAVIVDLSSRHSLDFAEAFSREFHVRRGRVMEEITFHPGDADLGSLLDRAAEEDVEGVLIMASHDDVLRMVEGSRSPEAAELVLLGAAEWEGAALEAALANHPGGGWRVSHFHPGEAQAEADGSAAVVAFVAVYEEEFGKPPSDIAALTYDTTRAVLSVFDPRADGSEMAERLRKIQYFVGVTGTVHMDAGGRPRGKSFVLEQLHESPGSAFFQRLGD